MSRSGIRYITEDFLKISAHEDRLEKIKKLNLDCGKDDKQIRYIEHLDNLTNLNVLSLRFHTIEKIEKLGKLVNLRELYLSENKICKLDGLENLLRLKILDVRGNLISTIPHWFARRCKYLTKINFSCNLFESVEEVSKLWILKDLVDLDLSENPVASIAHYRSYIIMRLKILQILDNREILVDERRAAIEQFEENELDRLTNKLIESEKQFEQMKETQIQLQKDHAQQEHYQKDLHKKQKSHIDQIKQLEDNLKSKDLLLKKKSEDLFRACQKYYELEQDIAFIKIDAKFDLLSNNLGSLEEPDNLSEHSQISSTGDHAYMGKGQFLTKKEADMYLERQRAKQTHSYDMCDRNEKSSSARKIKEDFINSLNDKVKEKLEELNQINEEISNKNVKLANLNDDINSKEYSHDSSFPTKSLLLNSTKPDRPSSAHGQFNIFSPFRTVSGQFDKLTDNNLIQQNGPSPFTDQFLDKVGNLTEMQKEAEDLRRQMESTEKESSRQQKDITYLRNQLEKLKTADPSLADQIENKVKEKENHVDENTKLYNTLSKRLDQLSLEIEKSMKDIQEIELKLLEDNQYFTEKMRQDINSALSKLSQSLPNKSEHDYKKIMENCHAVEEQNRDLQYQVMQQNREIEMLQSQLQESGMSSARRSARSIDDEVEILRQELNQLRHDALEAKDDLESEIEMEKVLNDELQKQIEDLKQNEEQIMQDLEAAHNKYQKLIDKVNSEDFLSQKSMDQQLISLQDDMIHRIKMASVENKLENLEKSKNPIDKALLHLIKSVIQSNKDDDNKTANSDIIKINGNLEKLKNEIKDMNRKFSTDSVQDQRTSTPYQTTNQNSNRNRSKFIAVRKMLSNSAQKYKDDMNGIRSRILDLHNILVQNSDFQKEPIVSMKTLKTSKLPVKIVHETSNDCSSSDGHGYIKSRTQSQDRILKRPKQFSPIAKKWSSMQQEISSDEQAAFDAVQDELHDLLRHIDLAEQRNAKRIEEALAHIEQLEKQFQAQNEGIDSRERAEYLDRETQSLSQHLRDTMTEVENCQKDIKRLNERLSDNIRISKLETECSELDNMVIVLQSQKAEIERLNHILERLCATRSSFIPPFTKIHPVIDPPLRSTSWRYNSSTPRNNNSYSTPLLNSDLYGLNWGEFGTLFCNVPEHHYFEDCFQKNPTNRFAWKLKREFKLESEKYRNTLETLQDDINRRHEELDNVEIQISKGTNEIERLNYQIDQLNSTKQDLLGNINSLRRETELVTRESIAATSETLGNSRVRKTQLKEELVRIESQIRDKKDEFLQTEDELKNCHFHLVEVQEQTKETINRFDEAKMNHKRVILECEELEKRSKEASFELARAMNNLSALQNQVSELSSNKNNLEDILTKIQHIINQKNRDFTVLNEEINKATQQLTTLQSNLNITAEENRDKLHMLSEGDQLLSDTRLELNRLKNEIVVSHDQLQKVDSELGERVAEVDIVNCELERSRQVHNRIIQDHQQEQNRIKQDLCDLKFELESMKDQKIDLTNHIENLKLKNIQIKDNIDNQEQTLTLKQSEVDKLNWETHHVDNMIKMKQSQLDKVFNDYQNKITDLEKIEEEIHQQQIESKSLDSEIKRKASEIDKMRLTIVTDAENMQRMSFDKENLESSISNLTKEKHLIQNEKKEVESNIKILRKQESQAHDSLITIESKISQARTELEKMYSEKCSETIKRDEIKIQSNTISKQLHEAKCELQSIKERVIMIEAQCDEKTSEIRKKMQLQNGLNIEIRKLQDQLRMANMSVEEINNHEQQKKEKLLALDGEITRKIEHVKNLENKISESQLHVLTAGNKFDKIMKNNSIELTQLKSEISEKLENLEATNQKLHQIKKDAAIKEFTEQKIFELEEIIRQQESNSNHYEEEIRRLKHHVSTLTKDIMALRQTHQFEMENKDKEMSKLKKRVAKEIFQLEKLAEDQCTRANGLSNDLNQARRDYMLLRNRIVIFGRFLDNESTCLAQEHFIEQQNLFKEYMLPNSSKLPNWESYSKADRKDLPINVETAILAEHRRHLQNQLDLIKENISAVTSQNGIGQHSFDNSTNKTFDNLKWHTSSSGLGSTLDHTGNSSDTFMENDRVKKALQTQFNEEIEKINSESSRHDNLCRQLRSEVDNLKLRLPREKSPRMLSE